MSMYPYEVYLGPLFIGTSMASPTSISEGLSPWLNEVLPIEMLPNLANVMY